MRAPGTVLPLLCISLVTAGCTTPAVPDEVAGALDEARSELNATLEQVQTLEEELARARSHVETLNETVALGRLAQGERDLLLLLSGHEGDGLNTLEWRLTFETDRDDDRLLASGVGLAQVLVVDGSTFNGTFNASTAILSALTVDPVRTGAVAVPPSAIVYVKAGTAPGPVREVVWAPEDGTYRVRADGGGAWETVRHVEGETLSLVFPGSRAVWIEGYAAGAASEAP